MSVKKMSAAGLAVAALALSGLVLAQGASRKTPASPSPTTAPMPKTDRMPMEEFKRRLTSGDVVLIDVRSSDSYADGHIPGALSIPLDTINEAVAQKLKKMGKPIATYCS